LLFHRWGNKFSLVARPLHDVRFRKQKAWYRKLIRRIQVVGYLSESNKQQPHAHTHKGYDVEKMFAYSLHFEFPTFIK